MLESPKVKASAGEQAPQKICAWPTSVKGFGVRVGGSMFLPMKMFSDRTRSMRM